VCSSSMDKDQAVHGVPRFLGAMTASLGLVQGPSSAEARPDAVSANCSSLASTFHRENDFAAMPPLLRSNHWILLFFVQAPVLPSTNT